MNLLEAINLKNFRGVRNTLQIALKGGKSFLLYGDNGSGKSSISDGVEWFYKDKVAHLSGEEIDANEGLRHALSIDAEDSGIELLFSEAALSSEKTLKVVKGKLKTEYLNTTSAFDAYLLKSGGENLFIRNQDLIQFIVATKGERLADISEIIGYSEINNTKAILRKALGDVKTQMKMRGFDNAISQKQAQIITQLKATINNDEQFIQAVVALSVPLKLSFKIASMQDLAKLKSELSAGTRNPDAELSVALSVAISGGEGLVEKSKTLTAQLKRFVDARAVLMKDAKMVAKVSVGQLLLEAQQLLSNSHQTDDCPLCLQQISRDDLLRSIADRIEQLKGVRARMNEIDGKRNVLVRDLVAFESELKKYPGELILKNAECSESVKNLANAIGTLATMREKCAGSGVNSTVVFTNAEETFGALEKILVSSSVAFKKVKGTLPAEGSADPRIEISSKLAVAELAYEDIKKLKREKDILGNQLKTLETLLSEFIETQRKGMTAFLKSISADMNTFYQFMNADEKVDDIELVSVDDKNGEFSGVAFKFAFHKIPVQSPKQYLSESHLNCLGLCLFLASVKAFNKINGFFILDDVISSFDKNHRTLFARLLVEKFGDYQMLIFTHEREWFELLSNDVRSKGWRINSTQWDVESGVCLDVPSVDIKEEVEAKIKKGDADGLGNKIRRFGERLLKEICLELEVDIPFRFNDRNEQRTFDELLGFLKKKLNAKTTKFKDSPVIARLSTSQFFGNKTSHGNSFEEVLADLKVCFKDITDFEAAFTCGEKKCGKKLSMRFYDKVGKKVRCKCGKLEVDWKD